MTTFEAKDWMTNEFFGRYSGELKPAMVKDWIEALRYVSYNEATRAIKQLYSESTMRPPIGKFRAILPKSQPLREVPAIDICRKIFVQLVEHDTLQVGQFKCIATFEPENPHICQQLARNLQANCQKFAGGQWEIIDFFETDIENPLKWMQNKMEKKIEERPNSWSQK